MVDKVVTPPHVKGIIVSGDFTVFCCDPLTVTLPVQTASDKSLFLKHCIPCFKRASKRCDGGTTTVTRGRCTEVSSDSRYEVQYRTVHMPVHFWIYSHYYTNDPYIFTVADDPGTLNYPRLKPLFLGNTYDYGAVCLGGATSDGNYDRYNPWSSYELYFRGIRNEDLNYSRPHIPIADYLDNWTIEKQNHFFGHIDQDYPFERWVNQETAKLIPPDEYSLYKYTGRSLPKGAVQVSRSYYIKVKL